MNKTLSGRLRELSLKTKKKSIWVLPKVVVVAYGSGRLRGLFITKFKSQFKRGLRKVLVSRAGRLREWSQGERRPYYQGRRHLSYIKL